MDTDEGTIFAGWIIGVVAAAGIYGALKNKPWLSVLTDAVNPKAKTPQSIYTSIQDATYIGSPTDGGATPPASVGLAGGVVGYAQAQLGKPYQWGAAGPDRFDCSGLTMRAFDTVGIHLPHNSAAQLTATLSSEIPLTNAPPAGALVFYGKIPHHVGISIGGGKMISAPHTGDVVKVSDIASFGSDLSYTTNPLARVTPGVMA